MLCPPILPPPPSAHGSAGELPGRRDSSTWDLLKRSIIASIVLQLRTKGGAENVSEGGLICLPLPQTCAILLLKGKSRQQGELQTQYRSLGRPGVILKSLRGWKLLGKATAGIPVQLSLKGDQKLKLSAEQPGSFGFFLGFFWVSYCGKAAVLLNCAKASQCVACT